MLVGWSLGVMEVLDYSTRYVHQDLRGLVLIDNSIGMAQPSSTSTSLNSANRPMNKDQFKAYVNRFAVGMFKTPPPDGWLLRIEQSATQLPPKAAWNLLNKPYHREYYKKAVLAADVPVWYQITPRFAEQSAELQQTHPRANSTFLNNAGHALFVDSADMFNQRLRHFLANMP